MGSFVVKLSYSIEQRAKTKSVESQSSLHFAIIHCERGQKKLELAVYDCPN